MDGTRRKPSNTFDNNLSRDLENIDIALSEGNPPRFERIWLKLSKRVLESRIPDMGRATR